MAIEWALVFVAAAAIIGILEWAKYFAKTAPTWVWHVALLPLSVAVALLIPGAVGVRILSAGVILLVTQVGYQLILQGVVELVKAWAAKAKG